METFWFYIVLLRVFEVLLQLYISYAMSYSVLSQHRVKTKRSVVENFSHERFSIVNVESALLSVHLFSF